MIPIKPAHGIPADQHGFSRAAIRRLAERRCEPVVSSVYLDVDGSHRPMPERYEEAFERLADELRRRARTRNDQRLIHSVDGDIDRMRGWVARGIDRSATRGVALFSCDEEDYFEAIEVPVPIRDEVGIGEAPHIRQLVEVLMEPEAFVLALVDRTHLRLLWIDGPRIEELPTSVTYQERSVDTAVELGSWEHRGEEAARIHLRRAAAEVDEAVRTLSVRQLILGGPDESLAEMEGYLHPTTLELVVGRAGVRVAAPLDEVASVASAVAERAARGREMVLVDEVRQRARGEYHVAVGLGATLAALADRRIATLVVGDGYAEPGARCPSCGHLGVDRGTCVACGSRTVVLDDIVEVVIEMAVAQDADVTCCRDNDLDEFGGIAAIERF